MIPSQPTPAEAALIERIRPHLTPDLLQPAYRRRVAAGGCDAMTGQCAVATEALYFALGGRSSGYTPMSIQHEGGTHWYLRTPDGRFLDVTASQFRTPVPYPAGRGRGFPTPARGAATPPPSRRAALVLARAGAPVLAGLDGLGAPSGAEPGPWLTSAQIRPWLALMAARGVSVVARSPRGFLRAWARAKNHPARLGRDAFSGQDWRQRRNSFVARHEAQRQAAGEPLWGPDNLPTRRHLALIAWAWSPDPRGLAAATRHL